MASDWIGRWRDVVACGRVRGLTTTGGGFVKNGDLWLTPACHRVRRREIHDRRSDRQMPAWHRHRPVPRPIVVLIRDHLDGHAIASTARAAPHAPSEVPEYINTPTTACDNTV